MKTIIKIYLSLALIISPIFFINSANAATLGGWTLGGGIAQGASTIYDATKTVIINGANVVKTSTVKITPVATDVAKVLARGAGGLALSVAVEQLLGAVDWVLDPANNRIVYYEKDSPAINDPTKITGYKITAALVGNPYKGVVFTSIITMGKYVCEGNQGLQGSGGGTWSFKEISGDYVVCDPHGTRYLIETLVNPNYDPNAVREEKTIPLETVAQKVISNAESGDTNAQVATTAAAADIVNDAETDNTKASQIVTQLESAAQTATDETATGETTKPNTSDPTAPPDVTNISLEFPVFCGWAPSVCEAAQVVITFPTTLTNWWDTSTQAISASWTTFKDWAFADDVLPESTPPVIDSIPTPELKEDAISWTASCPPDAQIPISLQGVSTTLVLSWSPWCQLLSMIKPAIVASAYIGAAFIVLGLRT